MILICNIKRILCRIKEFVPASAVMAMTAGLVTAPRPDAPRTWLWAPRMTQGPGTPDIQIGRYVECNILLSLNPPATDVTPRWPKSWGAEKPACGMFGSTVPELAGVADADGNTPEKSDAVAGAAAA